MDGTDVLPNDLRECQRLLLAAFQQATQLERRGVESEQQVAELNRVLSETSASYDIEDRACVLSPESRLPLRVAESIPVLDKIAAYSAELARTVLPKSSLAKAVNYAQNQGDALRRYTEDGRLTIDNKIGSYYTSLGG